MPQLLVLVVVGGELLDKPGVVFRVLVWGFGFFLELFGGLFLHGHSGSLGRFVGLGCAGFFYGFDRLFLLGVPGSLGRFVLSFFLGGCGGLVLFVFLSVAGLCGSLSGGLRFFGFSKGNGAQTGSATGSGFGIFLDKRAAFGTTGWHRGLVLCAKIHKMNDKSWHPAYFSRATASKYNRLTSNVILHQLAMLAGVISIVNQMVNGFGQF